MGLSNWFILPTGAQWYGASYHLFPPEKKLKKYPVKSQPNSFLNVFFQKPWISYHFFDTKKSHQVPIHQQSPSPSCEIMLCNSRARPCSRLKVLMPPILRKIEGRNRGQIHLPYGWAAAASGMTPSRMGSQLGSLCDFCWSQWWWLGFCPLRTSGGWVPTPS